jgi:chromosomal replication initiator protein
MQQLDAIFQSVTEVFGVTKEEILSDARPDRIAFPRQVAMALAVESLPGIKHKEVGIAFLRDRTNVIHAIRAVNNRCDTEPAVKEKVNEIRAALRGRVNNFPLRVRPI